MKKISAIIAFLILTSLCNAGNPEVVNIKGTVSDSASGQMVEYATVVLFNTADSSMVTGVISAADGTFKIAGIKKGTYYLTVQFVGYEKITISDIKITSDKQSIDLGNIKITPSSYNMGGVEVVAERNAIEYKIDKQVINAAQVISAATGTVLDLLRSSPSISIDNDDNVYLRGSTQFLLLIDGKPTVIEKKEAMRQIPSATVESIEIITNPSAKYDAEGTSGIINIVTKKIKKSGFSGIINARGGSFGDYGADANFMVSSSKFTINTGISYNLNKNPSFSNIDRQTGNTDTLSFISSKATRDNKNTNANIYAGIDYTPGKHHSISLNLGGGFTGYDLDMITRYDKTDNISSNSLKYISDYLLGIHGLFYNATLNYRITFDSTDHYLNFSAYGMRWHGNTTEKNTQYLSDDEWTRLNMMFSRELPEDNMLTEANAGVDYANTWKNGLGLELGYLYTLRPFRGKVSATDLDINSGEWIADPAYTQDERFNESKHAAYVTFSGTVLTIDFQLGLRSEYYKRDMELQPMDTSFNFSNIYFFPSIHLSRTFGQVFTLQASYSRRVNYPDDWALNPIPMYSDDYTYQTGNPNLEPEFIDAYELNMLLMLKKSTLTASLFYKQNNNALGRIFSLMPDGKLLITFDNLANEKYAGIELGGNFQIGKKLSINASGSVFWQSNEGTTENGNFYGENVAYSGQAMINYKVFKNTRTQLSLMYNGPTLHNNGTAKGFFIAGLSIRQDFFKQRFSATLSFQNFLNTFRYKYSQNGDGYTMTLDHWNKYPNISIGLSYRINNYRPNRSQQQNRFEMNVGTP